MSTKTKERINVIKERNTTTRTNLVENEFEVTNSPTSRTRYYDSDEIVGRRHSFSQGDTIVRKSIKYISPILVAILLYSIYGSMNQPTPIPSMHSTTHMGPILWGKVKSAWSTLRDSLAEYKEQEIASHGLEKTDIQIKPLENVDDKFIKKVPTVHHPHTATDYYLHPEHRHNMDFAHHTHGLNPWDPTKIESPDFFKRTVEHIDEKRDNIIAKLYGTTFNYKERMKKDLEESLRVFEETKLNLLNEWNRLYDNSYEEINKIRYKARDGYREGRDIKYKNSKDILGPLAY